MLRTACAVATTLMLGGCSALVPSTAARLASLDPLTADPAAIEVVAVLPPGFAVTPGSARLELMAERGAERLAGSFRLDDRPAGTGLDLSPGATAQRFAIAAGDIDRMRRLQADIAGWKREGEARGSLGIGLGGCAVGDGPQSDARGSVLIRVSADGPFLPLIDDGKLSDLLGPDMLAAIKACQGAE
jgi:hypothetical protein